MKTVIVPTDFSPAADNALHYAARLAQHVGAPLLLVHVYQVPVSMNDVPVMMLSADEMKKSADEMLERSRQELHRQFPDLHVEAESRLGGINDELDDICKNTEPFAVVVGTHGASGLERLLFGSTTLSLIRHAHYPVIAVPAGFNNFSARKIVWAADLLEPQSFPAPVIVEIVQQLRAQLTVVHVELNSETERVEPQDVLSQLQPLQPVYETIRHDNVKEGVLRYLDESGADLLLVLPHEHNLVERLFFKLHAEGIVQDSKIPVLSIRC